MAESDDSAEDRQLEPTARRLEKAREEGQFPQSRDLTTVALVATFLLFVLMAGPLMMDQLVKVVAQGLRFSEPDQWADYLLTWSLDALVGLAGVTMLLLLPIWIISIFSPTVLSGFRPHFAFKFNAGRLNPISGLGRIFSLNTTVEVLKSILKTVLILGVGMTYLIGLLGSVSTLIDQGFQGAMRSMFDLVMNGALLLLVPLLLIAVLDVTFQYFSFRKKMRMTQEEIKQEMKESEGSPENRARLRQRQRQIANSRMMAAVERADVVLANPEHYSVALRYDQATMAAPVVVAKGMDDVALRIQALAGEHQVPVARIPPLARLMYAKLEIGDPVPIQLFEAIARVLAWAYETRDGIKGHVDLPDLGELPKLEDITTKVTV